MMTLWQASVRDSVVSDIVERLSNGLTGFGQMVHENVDDVAGLYCFWVRGVCLYVGKSASLKRRLKEHCESETNPILVEHFDVYGTEIEMSVVYEDDANDDKLYKLESEAIKKMLPIANRLGKSK